MRLSLVRVSVDKVPPEALTDQVRIAVPNFPTRVSEYVYYLSGVDQMATKSSDRDSPLTLLHFHLPTAEPLLVVSGLLSAVEQLFEKSKEDASGHGEEARPDTVVLVVTDPVPNLQEYSLFANVFVLRQPSA